MARIDPELRNEFKNGERRTFSLLLKVSGDLDERRTTLESMGCRVGRTFKLTNSVSVHCSGETALSFSRRSWITRVERDGAVRAFGG
jgi:hypothetical protein